MAWPRGRSGGGGGGEYGLLRRGRPRRLGGAAPGGAGPNPRRPDRAAARATAAAGIGGGVGQICIGARRGAGARSAERARRVNLRPLRPRATLRLRARGDAAGTITGVAGV